MEDTIAKLLRTLWGVGDLGADHPDVFENLLIASPAGLNDQPAHRIDDHGSGTTVYSTG